MFTAGRVLLGLMVCAFGVQHIMNGHLEPGFFLPQAWSAPLPIVADLLGAILIVDGLALLIPAFAQRAAIALVAIIGAGLVAFNVPNVPAVFVGGTARTRVLEPLAIAAVALIVAALLGNGTERDRTLARIGARIYAFTLIVFGVQHFLYAEFLAALVPAWLPFHIVFVYVTGAAFIAAGIAIGANAMARIAAQSIALMFGLWALILHLPRATGPQTTGGEWASLFIAIAMCGCALIVASEVPATYGRNARA